MQEIWIPETLIVFFLVLPVIRPHNKKLKSMEGLSWLPLLALIISLALIPAYGWRPEAFPLLVYSCVLGGINIVRFMGDNSKFRNSRGRIFFAVPPLVLLAAAGIAFYFTPQREMTLSVEGVSVLKAAYAPGGNTGEREYHVRVYTEEAGGGFSPRPLLVLLPPVLGSAAAVDRVCCELRDEGFTVLSYARRGIDSSRKPRLAIGAGEWLWRFRALNSGTVSAKANARGRALEEARKEDLLFLLSWIAGNPEVKDKTTLFHYASADAIFFAGYDAGGSALVLLGNSPSIDNARGIKIRGLIAIESPLWSLYREELFDDPPLPPDSPWFSSVRYGLNRWLWGIKPKKIAGLGQIPELSRPLLFLVSDRIRDDKYRDKKYGALRKCFDAARSSALLVSVDGAGPLDYSDFPGMYPLIAAFYSGAGKPAWNRAGSAEPADAPGGTARIIANFAAGALEADGSKNVSLRKMPFPKGVRVEVR